MDNIPLVKAFDPSDYSSLMKLWDETGMGGSELDN